MKIKTRYKLLIFELLLLILTVIYLSSCAQNEAKPNIVFFLIDDQRHDQIGAAGHPFVQTPTVDKLAEEGVRFSRTYVTTSICAASRASLLTGLYENSHNFTFGKPPLRKELIETSYPYLLKQNGYNTGYVGKLGVALEDRDSSLNRMFDYYKFSKRNTPYFETLPDGSHKHSAEIKGDQAIEFLKNQTEEEPFLLTLSFNAVHAVDGNKTPGNEGHYPYPQSAADLYSNIPMPEPRLADSSIFNAHPEFMKKSMNRQRYFWRWDTPEKYNINLRAYYRMISGYDGVMKRVMDYLEENNLDKNTIFIYSADNGYYMGNRGFAGKWSHYEESLRVPLIIYDSRNKEMAGQLRDQLTLNLDIPATILEYAGVKIPESYEGRGLRRLVDNANFNDWRKEFFCEHRMNNPSIPKYYGVHTEKYVYVNYFEQAPPYEYLHDIEKDPDQLSNLVNNEEYSEILDSLRAKAFTFNEKN